ncbi:MAG: globin domain-containing protein [Rickettsiales bacterium]|nr:globin domain-containing protein [Rickettsiales bacterium]
MSITPEHVTLVQQSMEKVIPLSDTVASIFYDTLFNIDPSLKALFKHDMEQQKRKLMVSLDMIVKGLDQIDMILPAIEKLAIKHVSYGVKPEHYTLVGNALLITLQEVLGDDFTPALRAAWIEAFRTLATAMKNAAYTETVLA